MSDQESYADIGLDTDGPVAQLVLRRPTLRNALSPQMGLEVRRAVTDLNALDHVRAVLVRGEGKAFSAGGDFKLLEQRTNEPPELGRRAMRDFYRLYLSIRELRAPSIAVLHGAAIGAGLCFALGCDLRVAARGAKLGVNFVRVGLHPGMGATHLLPQIVGSAAAADLLLTGRIIDADEALRLGLVSRVFEPDEIDAGARAMASDIASAAPVAVAQTKVSMRARDAELDAALEREAYAQAICYQTDDMKAAISAFRDKRKPAFEGR